MEPVLLPPTRRFDRILLESEDGIKGRVLAVHEHAAVVRPDAEGPLVTLQHPSRDLVPCGIVIPWEEVCLQVGDVVELRDRTVLFAFRKVLPLEGEGVSLRMNSPPTHVRETGQVSNWSSILTDPPEFSTSPLPLLGEGRVRAHGRAQKLAEALCQNRSDLGVLVAGLTGLGPGSTPTGDDLLTGMAAAGNRLARLGLIPQVAFAAFLSALGAVSRDATTPVAWEMLQNASRGAFPEALLRVVMLLDDASPAEVRLAIDRLKMIGAQTGCDMLAGVTALIRAASQAQEVAP